MMTWPGIDPAKAPAPIGRKRLDRKFAGNFAWRDPTLDEPVQGTGKVKLGIG
jgi:hypothetical protein